MSYQEWIAQLFTNMGYILNWLQLTFNSLTNNYVFKTIIIIAVLGMLFNIIYQIIDTIKILLNLSREKDKIK